MTKFNSDGSIVVADPQINGSYDDGTDYGAVRTKLSAGELIRYPFQPGQYQAETSTGGTASWGTQIGNNDDGTVTSLNVTCTADPGRTNQTSVRVWIPFRGDMFAIRYRRDNTTTLPLTFSVSIDGVAYQVLAQDMFLRTEGQTGTTDEGLVTIATDLRSVNPSTGQPIIHHADVVLTADAAVTRTIIFLGYVVERRAGYAEKPRLNYPIGPSAVPTSAGNIITSAPSTTSARSMRGLVYSNTAASASTVTIYSTTTASTANQIYKLYLAAAGSAGDSVVLDWLDRISPSCTVGQITHLASQAGVNVTVLSGTN